MRILFCVGESAPASGGLVRGLWRERPHPLGARDHPPGGAPLCQARRGRAPQHGSSHHEPQHDRTPMRAADVPHDWDVHHDRQRPRDGAPRPPAAGERSRWRRRDLRTTGPHAIKDLQRRDVPQNLPNALSASPAFSGIAPHGPGRNVTLRRGGRQAEGPRP